LLPLIGMRVLMNPLILSFELTKYMIRALNIIKIIKIQSKKLLIEI